MLYVINVRCRMLHSVMMRNVLYNNKVIRGIGPGVIEVDVGALETYIRDVEYDLIKQAVKRHNIIIISFCCYGLSSCLLS